VIGNDQVVTDIIDFKLFEAEADMYKSRSFSLDESETKAIAI
jgi:hypothetical protein